MLRHYFIYHLTDSSVGIRVSHFDISEVWTEIKYGNDNRSEAMDEL
jgi:hypothetical protein